jgi:hypothetical protein
MLQSHDCQRFTTFDFLHLGFVVGPGCWTGHSVGWDFEEKEAPLRVVADLTTQSWEHVRISKI